MNFRVEKYFVDLVKKLLKDQHVDIVFNVVKYIKDILGPQFNVSKKYNNFNGIKFSVKIECYRFSIYFEIFQ